MSPQSTCTTTLSNPTRRVVLPTSLSSSSFSEDLASALARSESNSRLTGLNIPSSPALNNDGNFYIPPVPPSSPQLLASAGSSTASLMNLDINRR